MSKVATPDLTGLRAIVVVQGVAGAIVLVPLMYYAALTFERWASAHVAVYTIWTIAALATALFNIFGGVALYYNPRRRLIFGSLAASGLLLMSLLFL
jgi:predicted phage tail protein